MIFTFNRRREIAGRRGELRESFGDGEDVAAGSCSAQVGRAFRVRREDVDALLERASAESSSLATRRDVWTPTTTTLPRAKDQHPSESVWEGAQAKLPAKRR